MLQSMRKIHGEVFKAKVELEWLKNKSQTLLSR
jgi:hypothetical protein